MEAFLAPDYLRPENFLKLTIVLFFIIFIRYLLVSGLYHYIFFTLFRKKLRQRIINASPKQKKQLKKEIYWSAITSLIFAVSGTGMVLLWQRGYTQIYTDFSAYPMWYTFVGVGVALFIHETYYYWIHRWMHRPKIFRRIHKVHHESTKTSSLTSFSFHPIESVLQAIVVPVIVLFLPLHIYAILFLLMLMTFSGTINHAGVEIYPKSFQRHWLGKWLIGATHHDLHHKQFRFNFGLYFTFWDKWMHTESPDFEEKFEEKTNPL